MACKVIFDKTKMQTQERSQGDGMEMNLNLENSFEKLNYGLKEQDDSFMQNKSRTLISSSIGKRKEPKFIPYEPYKAAVMPIMPKNIEKSQEKSICNAVSKSTKPGVSRSHIKCSDNNQINSDVTNKCLSPVRSETSFEQTKEIKDITWLAEKLVLENTIKQLKEEKKELEMQFNVQTKVNADLKKLLVASLGEDMQVKVHSMSEDKAKLGEHVLFYSQKLSQNNEELEKLTLQCDMWKSKVDASKLLINECTAWKAVLSRKLNESTEAIQCLLDERKELYLQLEDSIWALHHIQEAFDPSAKRNFPCTESLWNVIQISAAIRGLSDEIQNRLLGRSFLSKTAQKFSISQTPGELKAMKVISSLEELPLLAEQEIDNKQINHKESHFCINSSQSFSKEATVNCCKHCSGKVRLV